MVKDFDFRSAPRAVNRAPVSEKKTEAFFPESSPQKPKNPKRKNWLINIFIVIAVVSVAVFSFWYYFSTLPSTDVGVIAAPETPVLTAASQSTIVVFDRGAGQEAVNRAVTEINNLGLQASGDTNRLLTYTQNYIFHGSNDRAAAERIARALNIAVTSLRQAPAPGVFIYLAR